MKLTSKGNYAIASMLDLALNSEIKLYKKDMPDDIKDIPDDTDGLTKEQIPWCLIPLKDVAHRLELSENYLRQLFMELTRENLVGSFRGVGGGYYLMKDPSETHILDIVEAVEGRIYVVPCLDIHSNKECYRETICSAKSLWTILNQSIIDGLYKLTLQDLIDEYVKEKGENTHGEERLQI